MGDRAKEYFQALEAAIEDDDEEQIIEVASQLLNFIPNDVETRKCRAIAYLRSGKFQEAFADLEPLKNVDFERCMCLYGLGKYRDVLTFIGKLPPAVADEPRWQRLREQVYFRFDDAQALRDLYSHQDFAAIDEDERSERLVNISAGLAVIGDVDGALGLLGEDARVEQIYNTATACVNAGHLEKATELIERGLAKCPEKSTYRQLLGLLKLQLTSRTQPEAAADDYLKMVDDEEANQYVRTVAASNYAALTLETNVNGARKKMSFFDDNKKYDGYRKCEIEPFLINRFLILHKIGQPNKVKALIEFAKSLPSMDKLIAESFDRTVDPMKAAPTKLSPLFIAQALINQNKFVEAAELLAKSELIQHPRTIAVVTELYLTAQKMDISAGKPDEGKLKVDAAIKFLNTVKCDLPEFMEFAAMFCFHCGYYKESAAFADKLVKARKDPRSTSVQAVALSHTDIEMAERYVSRLQVPDVDPAKLDALEATPVEAARAAGEAPAGDVLFDVEGKKKVKRPLSEMSPEKLRKLKEKKRRRRRLQKPANYDPNKKMDPERWIPFKKRAANRKKRKTQNKKQQQQKKGGKKK